MEFRDLITHLSPGIPAVAVDFETYYDDECSVSGSSYWTYTHHPKFDPYMVAIYSKELGIEFVGHPKDFDWGTIAGYIWVAHNSPFDQAVYESMTRHLKWMPHVQCHTWINSADICRYKGVPGSLAKAMKVLYDVKRSKQVRSDMKGKRFDDVDDDEKERWLDYAMDDARDCYRIWDDFKHEWPRREMLLSIHTCEQIRRGVYVDRPALEADLVVLQNAVTTAERMIPWAGEVVRTKTGKIKTKKGQPVLKSPTSSVELKKYCRDNGIPVPKTTSVKEKAYQEWEALYGKQVPIVKHIQTWRRCNRLVRVIEDIIGRIRDDGRMEFPMCYFGAGNTGRWSGRPGGYSIRGEDEKGINMQNLLKTSLFFDKDCVLIGEGDAEDKKNPPPKETDYIFNLRHRFVAPPGKRFAIFDASQIEPRVLAVLSGDTDFLERCKKVSPYQAHAEVTMGWDPAKGSLKDNDKPMYALAKARCLHGTVPVFTDHGYYSVKELSERKDKRKNIKLWDGSQWINYEGVIRTGHKIVREYRGEHYTEDHRVFTNTGTRPIGEVYSGGDAPQLLGRNIPGNQWKDVWQLAGFVGRTLTKEWLHLCKGKMRGLWERSRGIPGKFIKQEEFPVRNLWEKKGKKISRHKSVGESPRQNGLSLGEEMGRHDEKVLQQREHELQKLRETGSKSS